MAKPSGWPRIRREKREMAGQVEHQGDRLGAPAFGGREGLRVQGGQQRGRFAADGAEHHARAGAAPDAALLTAGGSA